MKKLRNQLISSILVLVLCFTSLIGTTFAWFTDSVTSSGNKIQSGTLKVDLELLDKESGLWNSIKETEAPLFTYQNWEPGYTDVTLLKVENEGSLALNWEARFFSNTPISDLAKVIDVYVKPSATPLTYPTDRNDISAANGWDMVGTLDQFIDTLTTTTYGSLKAYESAYLGIALHMQEGAGNEYQNLTLGTFDIHVLATQDTLESDSFGDDYDNSATWPEIENGFTATRSLADVTLVYGELASELVIKYSDDVYAVLPAGVKLKDGISSLKFTGKSVNTGSNVVVDDSSSSKNYDIHIEGIADDNTQPIYVYLGKILNAGISDTELKLYHETEQMTRVSTTADFSINNQFTYDAATGEVVLYVDSFSVFSVIQTNTSKWDGTSDTSWYNKTDTEFTLTTAAQLAGFRDLVDGGNTFAGKTVNLGSDIDLTGIPFDPIGFGYYDDDDSDGTTNYRVFMGTFDGAGHTIYNLYENCWELDPDKTNYSTYTYSTAGAGLFASVKDATIKNLAVSGAEIVFECVDMGVIVGYAQGECHFENIVVTDSNIANYNRYTGGVVGEVSFGPYGIDTAKGYSHTFKNVTVDSSVKVSGLWGSFGCGMGGVIGGKWGDATVKMENVISAAEMDVYNDVVSAYQWYAFRGCGMLIGHTEEPYSDGRHSGNATASFLTCENVKVYYGDWVNYHYYEFENQDNATGQRYPWVRAEAGEYCDAFSNIRYGVPTHSGVKVSDLTEEELKAIATDYTPIVFDQLYGADRGMYGTATHDGVTVLYKNVKTIYIQNNLNWTNLKLYYWYSNGEDTWSNLDESIEISPLEDGTTYKVKLPAYAAGFKITSAESAEGKTFEPSKLSDGENITLDGEHVHSFVNQVCVCDSVKFEFGENDSAGHSDGSENSKYTETVEQYTLTLTESLKVYHNAHDAQGNSCLKLGTGSAIGSFTFTVPENVNEVIICVAKYKANASTVAVNGQEYELVKNSDDGEYDEIVVNTTENKTVTVATTTNAKRCMLNSIVFVVEKLDHEHNYESAVTDPTCTEDGYTTYTCSICEHSYVEAGEKKTGHSYSEEITTEATCTEKGEKTLTCSTCGDIKTEAIDKIDHNYVDGTCSACGDKLSTADVWQLVTDVSDLKAGDKIVIVAKEYDYAISTTQKSNNRAQAAVTKTENQINFGGDIQIITLEAGTVEKTFAFNTGSGYLYAASSNDNYLRIEDTLDENGSWKIDIADDGTATIVAQGKNTRNTMQYNQSNSLFSCYASASQKAITIYKLEGGSTGNPEAPSCEHTNTTTTTVDATCTEAGSTTVTCDDCGETVSTEEIEALGHTTDNGTCERCGQQIGATEPTPDPEPTVVLEITKDDFNSTSYAANNNTKTENGYSYTSYQVMNQSSAMQWQKSNGYITVDSDEFVKLELKVTAGTYTVTVGGSTVTGTTSNGVTTYDLTGLTGEIKIAVGGATGKVDYIKFYK